jgi:predicted  nucleic acid-binding Zn-ribbon protein
LKFAKERNKELEHKIETLNGDYNMRLSDLKNKNAALEREVDKFKGNFDEKDNEVFQMKEKMKEVIEENTNMYTMLNNLKSILNFILFYLFY